MKRAGKLSVSSILAVGMLAVLSLLLGSNDAGASSLVVFEIAPATFTASPEDALCVAMEGGGPYVGCSAVYTNVQAAVDAASDGDVIKIASGVYTGVQTRPSPPDYNGSVVISQVVFISRSITVLGGYTVTNWTVPYPITQPVILDAQSRGRGVFINSGIAITMTGLWVTGGNAYGLGGAPVPRRTDVGGGVYVGQAAVVRISNSRIYSNTTGGESGGGYGGGLYAYACNSLTLSDSAVLSNTATGGYGSGGGMYVSCQGKIVIEGNVVSGNRGTPGNGTGIAGGGMVVESLGSQAMIRQNVISNNDPRGPCGGLAIGSNTTVSDNLVTDNTAAYFGGGLCVWDNASNVLVERNTIVGNKVIPRDERGGGGVYIRGYDSNAVFANNQIVANELIGGGHGAGIQIEGCQCSLLHSTIARNFGGGGEGIYVGSPYASHQGSVVYFTNTILVSHTIGIYVGTGDAVVLEATLWGTDTWANDTDWTGEGTILTGTINIRANPDFVNPDEGDYHIGSESGARDVGIDAGIFVDIDGQPRPMGSGYDIGADEYPPYRLYLPIVLRDLML